MVQESKKPQAAQSIKTIDPNVMKAWLDKASKIEEHMSQLCDYLEPGRAETKHTNNEVENRKVTKG